MDSARSHNVPPFAKLGRQIKPPSIERTPEHDDDMSELVFSAGWLKFLRTLSEPAKAAHRALVSGNHAPGAEPALVASLAMLLKVLAPVYEKAGVPIPEYILVLLTGEFPT